MTETTSTTFRVRPRVWIGIAIWLAYTLLAYFVQLSTGIPYPEFGASAGNLFIGAGLSLIIGTVFLAITASLLGWWRPALFDRRHSVRWPIFVPALMAVAVLCNLAGTDWASYTGAFFAASLALVLVGFTEEMANRGLLLVALRSKLSEVWVWFLTSAAFGLMHLTNAFNGQDLPLTLQQVGQAFLAGTVFYILRRTTGSLIWAMVLHGLWDFSTFAIGTGEVGFLALLGGTINIVAGVAGLAVVWFVIRGADERTTPAA